MSNDSSFKQITYYPKKYGLSYETHLDTKKFYFQPYDSFLKTRYIIYEKGDLTFFSQASYGAKSYTTSMFTGVYKPITRLNAPGLSISRKDWLDGIFHLKKIKTQNDLANSKLTFTTQNKNYKRLHLSTDFIHTFVKLNEALPPIKLIVQNDYLQQVKTFRGKTIIGIETNKWVYEFQHAETMFSYGESLIREMEKLVQNY